MLVVGGVLYIWGKEKEIHTKNTGWWFEKYARQIGFIFPNFGVENKENMSNHHLE